MNIKDWPLAERPREKLLRQGAESLSDAELLAVVLGSGLPGKNIVDLSRSLLQKYGGIKAFLGLDRCSFLLEPGLGLAHFAKVQAIKEINARMLYQAIEGQPVMAKIDIVRLYLKSLLMYEESELFGCLFLDAKHRVLGFEILFRGTIDRASVYPREVVKRAIANNAAAMILCHNHPSGNAQPSGEDVLLTNMLAKALLLIDVRVLDHFVIGDGDAVSMLELGKM
ncbi:hypothetical protein A9L43_10065 [Pseudomonas mosselii]|uniref:RadC family protein n=1 Tax=Pseudomonas mosselii TaxID=78327 RepID=UPI00083CC181|nr:DNA repair protein RadC [Pseudomonas mosselii]ODB41182.1 hypothetical protein A9L43_10065 [Pseudomonas mosselii]